MKKILLVGPYCQNNFGDDILFYIIEEIVKQKHQEVKINVVTANPLNTYETDSRVSYVSKRNLMAIMKTILSCDTVIIGPGSVFSGLFDSKKETLFVFYVSIFTRFFFKKLIFLGIDYTPIQSKFLSFLANFCLSLSDKIYVRFKQNYLNLDRNHFLGEKLEQVNDIILSKYTMNLFGLQQGYKKIKKQALVVISDLSFSFHTEPYEKFISYCIHLLKKDGYNVKILSLNMSSYGNKDIEYMKVLNQTYGLGLSEESYIDFQKWNRNNIYEAIKIIGESDFIISNKLHSNVVAAFVGTNILSFSYHDKMRHLNASIDLKEVYNFDIDKLLDEKDVSEYQAAFFNAMESIRELDGLNFDVKKVELEVLKNQDILENIKV